MVETLALLVILKKKRGRKTIRNNIRSNLKQNLQKPFQPWALAHEFWGVLPKSSCSGCEHLPRFIGVLSGLRPSRRYGWPACMSTGISPPLDRPPAWLGQSLSQSHRAFWCVGQGGNGWQFPRCAGQHEQIGKDGLGSLPASFNHHWNNNNNNKMLISWNRGCYITKDTH